MSDKADDVAGVSGPDVVTDEQLAKAEADHLLARKLLEKEPEQAAEMLAKVLEIKTRKYGDESEELIPAWTHYGRALFENARGHTDAVANKPVKRKAASQDTANPSTSAAAEQKGAPSSSAAAQEPAAPAETQAAQAASAGGEAQDSAAKVGTDAAPGSSSQAPASAGDKVDSQAPGPEQVDDEEEEEGDGDAGSEGSDQDEGEEGDEEAGEGDGEDLQLAWEALELARLLCNKYGAAKHASYLADVHLTLGELSAEKEDFTTALTEYARCQEVLEGMQDKDNRRLSEVHFNSMTINILIDQLPEALGHCQDAITALKQSRKKLMVVMDTPVDGETGDEAEAELERLEAQLEAVDQALSELKEKEQELNTAIKEQISFKNVLKNRLQQIMALQDGGGAGSSSSGSGAGASGSGAAPQQTTTTTAPAVDLASAPPAATPAAAPAAAAAPAPASAPVQNLGVAGRGRSRITLQPCQPTSSNVVASSKGASPAAGAAADVQPLKRAAGEALAGSKPGPEGQEEGGPVKKARVEGAAEASENTPVDVQADTIPAAPAQQPVA